MQGNKMKRKTKFAFWVKAALLAFMVGMTAASPASAALPKNHGEFMKDEDYKENFEWFTAAMAEAKGKLSGDDYAALEKENDETIAESVREDMEVGSSEVDAYGSAYWMRGSYIEDVIVWDWLRKNATGVIGFYRLKSDAFDGFMTVRDGQGDEEGAFSVRVLAAQKGEAGNSGEVESLGDMKDGKMTVSVGDDGEFGKITVSFDGETAKLVTDSAFKESGYTGNGVVLDGDYVRERR